MTTKEDVQICNRVVACVAFVLLWFMALFVLFWGDPDYADALVARTMGCQLVVVTQTPVGVSKLNFYRTGFDCPSPKGTAP